MSAVVSEQQAAARAKVAGRRRRHPGQPGGGDGGQDKYEGDAVQAVGGEGGAGPGIILGSTWSGMAVAVAVRTHRDIADPGVAPGLAVGRVLLHQLHCRAGEVAAVDAQPRGGVSLQQGKHGGARAAADLHRR